MWAVWFILGVVCGVGGIIVYACLSASSMESEAERKKNETDVIP